MNMTSIQSGYVSMPLIGAIRAAGRTQAEFGRDVANRYRRGGFLQDPNVTVAIVQFKPFYVLGEATTPGEYPFRSGLNVHAAVAMAGGFTYRASRSYCPHSTHRGRGLEGISSYGTCADCAWRFNSSARKIFLGGAGPSPPSTSRRDEWVSIFHALQGFDPIKKVCGALSFQCAVLIAWIPACQSFAQRAAVGCCHRCSLTGSPRGTLTRSRLMGGCFIQRCASIPSIQIIYS